MNKKICDFLHSIDLSFLKTIKIYSLVKWKNIYKGNIKRQFIIGYRVLKDATHLYLQNINCLNDNLFE